MINFKDESFIQQFLSPKVMRDMHLFALENDSGKPYLDITAIHNDSGYQRVREMLAAQHNLGNLEPNIQVYSVNIQGDRSLTLRHYMHCERNLEKENAQAVLEHVRKLWGFDVTLESVDKDDKPVTTYTTMKTIAEPKKETANAR